VMLPNAHILLHALFDWMFCAMIRTAIEHLVLQILSVQHSFSMT
jgi:hypothetical protein